MKDIKEYIIEAGEWNPSLNSHKNAYNSFIKWYDRQLRHMDKDELLDMLKTICNDVEHDCLDSLR